MAAGLQDFIKKNVTENTSGRATQGFLLFDIANLASSEHKLKSIVTILRDLVASKAVQGGFFAGLFLAMGRSIRALVHDTGSLEQALKKLGQIEALKNVFTPLVGGAEAAKRKVAELVNFAATKKLKLGDVGEAARNLQTSTQGGFAGPKALEAIADAAASTGNSIIGVSSAVGELSQQLQSGASIKGTVEQMKELGLVSDSDADKLVSLQESGADANTVFIQFTNSLEKFHGPAKAAADDIDSVNQAYENAAANLQEKFASPFVESDVENTKNMTDAMNGIAPVVGRVSSYLALLTNGFGTTKSTIAKFAGESKVAQGVIETLGYALGTLISIGAILGASTLATFMFTFGKSVAIAGLAATDAATGFVAAAGGMATFGAGLAAMAVSVLSVVGALVIAAGVGKQIGDAFDRSAKAVQDFQVAQNQANEAIRKQTRDAKNLIEVQNALAAATTRVVEAQRELSKARQEGSPDKVAAAESALAIAQKNRRDAKKKDTGPGQIEQEAARQQVEREKEIAEQSFQQRLQAAPAGTKSQLLGRRAVVLNERADKGKAGEQARIQFERDSAGATKALQDAQERLTIAEEKRKDAEVKITEAQKITNAFGGGIGGGTVTNAFGGGTAEDVADAERQQAEAARETAKAKRDILAAQTKINALGVTAPTESSVALETQARILSDSNDPKKAEKLADLNLRMAKAKSLEEERSQNELAAKQASADQQELDRQISLDNSRLKTEQEIANIKEDGFARSDKEMSARLRLLDVEEAAERARGVNTDPQALSKISSQRKELQHEQRLSRERNAMTKSQIDAELKMQQAQLKGDTSQRRRIGDLSLFTSKFEELLGQGFEKAEATKLATQFSTNAVALNANQTELKLNAATVADSLTRIGGGGGVYAPGGGDPMIGLAQRQNQLTEMAVKYLEDIASRESGVD